ncbi:hypothetical protein BOTBODRAFT_166021 [Botryobasidium botryosum FD-172 SS1]|uniref:G domain-containing protein n=1 Tax=Botryobasidium botryosum (strain FD-172 SS1) TaxID=930990 RepID=A0A067LYL3_BOTB1|nr:hypothetical protein BOTBODRAFT_166021 [Botryobasidium botryosum FD-172 SS1]
MTAEEDVIIAVMGPTGAGKTTLINQATGGELGVGHGLQSMTDSIQIASFEYGGRRIRLIDTPGFDDTNKTDTDILELISTHLAAAYKRGHRLTGLIYLHRIIDNRVGGVSYKNMKMFHKLCGDDVLKNVVLCTTMWSGVPEEVGAQREEQLQSEFWPDMIRKGATIARHDGTRESARRIVSHVMSLGGAPPLLIQREMIDDGKLLIHTTAGAHANEELMRLEQLYRKALEDAQGEYQEALAKKDLEMRRMVTRERESFEARLKKAEEDRVTLQASSKAKIEAMERKIRELEEGPGYKDSKNGSLFGIRKKLREQRKRKAGTCTIA